jgi:transmembrane sensor
MTKRDELDPMISLTSVASDEAFADLDPIQREAYEWIVRFLSGEMSAADVAAMKAWYGQSSAHAAAYADARRAWNALGPIASVRMRDNSDAVPAAHDVRELRPAFSASVGRRAFLGGGVLAASAAYLAFKPPLELWPSYSEWIADYRTGAGEHRRVTLANAVSFDLNTRTSIAVRSQAADTTQLELISGEAAISTNAASEPLTVIAGSGRIIATRSDFNLRCEGPRVSITCLKGSLLLERDGSATPLVARQQVTYGDRAISAVTTIDPDIVTAWQHGLLIFEATPVTRVIAEVNRYRSGRIVLLNDDIGRRLLTAQLRTVETHKIVTQIVQIFGAKARAFPGGIIILT